MSDDETSTRYVENKLSAPQGGVRKEVKLLYPLQCHKMLPQQEGLGMGEPGDLQALAPLGGALG